MAEESVSIKLHHNGQFLKTKYSGGTEVSFTMDPDLFSYSVLMEWVKELNYTEIGGVYVRKRKNGGWTLLTDDKSLSDYIKCTNQSSLEFFIDCDVDTRVEPMKQMQPHVVVRPRPSPLKPKEAKRKYVTIKDIQLENERRMSTRKKLQLNKNTAGPEMAVPCSQSANEGKIQLESCVVGDIENTVGGAGLEDMAKMFEKIDEGNGSTDSVDIEETADATEDVELEANTQVPGLTNYELLKKQNVQVIKEKMEELGLIRLAAKLSEKNQGKRPIINDSDQSEDYIAENDADNHLESDEDEIIKSKKKKKDKIIKDAVGPTTRSRAGKSVVSCEKKVVEGLVSVEENEPSDKKLKRFGVNSAGSMAAYVELMKRKQLKAQIEMPESQPLTDDEIVHSGTSIQEKPKNRRGKTTMDHVHTRREKREIKLNARGQPIADDDKILSELSHFLGTTVRQYVPLTLTSWHEVGAEEKKTLWQYISDKFIIPDEGQPWVDRTMRDQWRVYKCRIKRDYYKPYKTDEERIKNKPKDTPVNEFRVLLDYWADAKIEAAAKRNAESRKFIVETHTAGPKSFAQVGHKMVLEKLAEKTTEKSGGDVEEPPAPPSMSQIFIKTRKRDPNREYKLPATAVMEKIDGINKVLQNGGSIADADGLVSAGSHSSSWLLGRHVPKRQSKNISTGPATSSSNVSQDYLAELTTKVDQLTHEMDNKVNQKVQETIALMLKKLAENNPGLNVDVNGLMDDQSRDIASDGHNVTPSK